MRGHAFLPSHCVRTLHWTCLIIPLSAKTLTKLFHTNKSLEDMDMFACWGGMLSCPVWECYRRCPAIPLEQNVPLLWPNYFTVTSHWRKCMWVTAALIVWGYVILSNHCVTTLHWTNWTCAWTLENLLKKASTSCLKAKSQAEYSCNLVCSSQQKIADIKDGSTMMRESVQCKKHFSEARGSYV